MTTEEYEKKMSELRKLRNAARAEADKYAKEMDKLVGDQEKLNHQLAMTSYIILNKLKKGGYQYYLKVYGYDEDTRGVHIYGYGFRTDKEGGVTEGLDILKNFRITWEEIPDVSSISQEDFEVALEQKIVNLRKLLYGKFDTITPDNPLYNIAKGCVSQNYVSVIPVIPSTMLDDMMVSTNNAFRQHNSKSLISQQLVFKNLVVSSSDEDNDKAENDDIEIDEA